MSDAAPSVHIVMPQLGETIAEGTVSKWLKQVGDHIRLDEPLFEVETEKVSSEIPSSASGVLQAILVAEGETVPVGTPLAAIGPDSLPAIPDSAEPARVTVPLAQSANAAGEAVDRDTRLSPVVRRLLSEHHLSAAQIVGTGPAGRITREDILAHLQAKPADESAVDTAADHLRAARVPLNSVRRQTAKHVTRSIASSAHVLQAIEVDFEAIDQLRRNLKAEWIARNGFSLTFLPFVAYSLGKTLPQYPHINATFDTEALILHPRINLGVAVDLSFNGLVVPVIKDVNEKSLRSIATEAHVLAKKAREHALSLEEVSDGTYTISNSGGFGTLITAPIINQPQVAILSLDSVRRSPVVLTSGRGESIGIRATGVLAQSFDHRAFDGAYSASFLRDLKAFLEDHDWKSSLQ